jgi:hypothetical protein
LQISQAGNTEPRKMILLPRYMTNLKGDVKSPFNKTQVTDCLMKFGFEPLDADRIFNDLEKQGHFLAIDIDKTLFKWASD